MLEKREWVLRHADHLRRALMLEPRGHADMYGAILTEPVAPGSHAGVLFMHNEGYSTMCGHGVIAVTTIALERGLLMPGGDGRSIVYDTPAGVVRVTATMEPAARAPGAWRVTRVSFQNVPSFVLRAGKSLTGFIPPCDPLRARRCRGHRIQPRVRDDRDTPLCGVDVASHRCDLG